MFTMISHKEAQQRQVAMWGADKVARNEADVARRTNRPDKRRAFDPVTNCGEALIRCHAATCETMFYFVEARGERAPYCLDCADRVFGTQREHWNH